ncbi:hypothetical protein ACWGDT_25265 [Streptomyces avermitilis]
MTNPMGLNWNKKIAAGGIGFLIACMGAFFGYEQLAENGLDDLPSKPCNGAVDRTTVANVLPDAKKAEERGKHTDPGKEFKFYCSVKTDNGSILSAEAEARDAAEKTWSTFYDQSRSGNKVEVPAGDAHVLSWPKFSAVYILCTPPGRKASEAVQSYALTVDARIIGKSRVQGNELRRALTSFALQVSEYAHEAGKCQESATYPTTSPAIDENSY